LQYYSFPRFRRVPQPLLVRLDLFRECADHSNTQPPPLRGQPPPSPQQRASRFQLAQALMRKTTNHPRRHTLLFLERPFCDSLSRCRTKGRLGCWTGYSSSISVTPFPVGSIDKEDDRKSRTAFWTCLNAPLDFLLPFYNFSSDPPSTPRPKVRPSLFPEYTYIQMNQYSGITAQSIFLRLPPSSFPVEDREAPGSPAS